MALKFHSTFKFALQNIDVILIQLIYFLTVQEDRLPFSLEEIRVCLSLHYRSLVSANPRIVWEPKSLFGGEGFPENNTS